MKAERSISAESPGLEQVVTSWALKGEKVVRSLVQTARPQERAMGICAPLELAGGSAGDRGLFLAA